MTTAEIKESTRHIAEREAVRERKPVRLVTKHTSIAEPLEYKIVKDEEVDLTVDRAYKFLEQSTFQGERPVREGHVQFLYDEAVAGQFLWHLVTVASARLDEKVYRINGQHTCWMRVHLDGFKGKALVREITYKVEDGEQLRALYSAYDRNAPRTTAHVGRVQLIGAGATEGIPDSYIGGLISGYRGWVSGNFKGRRGRSNSITDIIASIKDRHSDLFNIVGRFFVMHYDDAIFVRRSAIIAAMFATFDKVVKPSDEFWSPIFTGLQLEDKNDHRYQLRRYIESHSHTIGRGKDVITQEDLFRVCINMWNHWRAGHRISSVRVPGGEERPKVKA